jgi:hypothetical protein
LVIAIAGFFICPPVGAIVALVLSGLLEVLHVTLGEPR